MVGDRAMAGTPPRASLGASSAPASTLRAMLIWEEPLLFGQLPLLPLQKHLPLWHDSPLGPSAVPKIAGQGTCTSSTPPTTASAFPGRTRGAGPSGPGSRQCPGFSKLCRLPHSCPRPCLPPPPSPTSTAPTPASTSRNRENDHANRSLNTTSGSASRPGGYTSLYFVSPPPGLQLPHAILCSPLVAP